MSIFVTALFVALVGVSIGGADTSAMGKLDGSDSPYIPQGETVDGSAYLAGNTVRVEGTVNGDLYCAGQSVVVTGTIEGSVFCAAQNIEIDGTVKGGMRLAAQQVTMRGSVGQSASVFASTVDTEKTFKVGQDLNGAAERIRIAGEVGRDLAISASDVTIAGTIGRDVQSATGKLTVASGATVNGGIHYTSENDLKNDGTVKGAVVKSVPETGRTNDVGETLLFILSVALGMLLLSLAVALAMPKKLEELARIGSKDLLKAVGIGFIVALVAPIIIITLLISGVGVPLALLLIAIWVVIGLLSGPVVAYFVGRSILEKSSLKSVMMRMLIGSLVLILIYMIPVLGIFAMIAVGVIGTGMLMLSAMRSSAFARQ